MRDVAEAIHDLPLREDTLCFFNIGELEWAQDEALGFEGDDHCSYDNKGLSGRNGLAKANKQQIPFGDDNQKGKGKNGRASGWDVGCWLCVDVPFQLCVLRRVTQIPFGSDNKERQQQIPFGNDNQKGEGKDG